MCAASSRFATTSITTPTLVVDEVDGAAEVQVDEVHADVLLEQQLRAAGEHVGVGPRQLFANEGG